VLASPFEEGHVISVSVGPVITAMKGDLKLSTDTRDHLPTDPPNRERPRRILEGWQAGKVGLKASARLVERHEMKVDSASPRIC
jgi:hypothetical protein